jgi:hypothetical protein
MHRHQVRHQCIQCKKRFNEYFLTVLHIRNRHTHLSAFIPESNLGWLGGLLKPQPSESFKRTRAQKSKTKPSAKPVPTTPKKDTGKMTQRSKMVSTQVCSLVNSKKATPSRARDCAPGINQSIVDWHRQGWLQRSPQFGK